MNRSLLITVRITSAAVALLGAGQAVLAGGFLSGHYDMVRMHLFTGVAMIVLTFGQAALLVLLRRTVPRDVLRFGLLLPVLLTFQAALGMTRILILHVPIGVFMVLGVLRLALLVWRVTPAEQAPAEQAPAEQAPAEQAPAEQAPAEKVPPEQGPAKQGAAKQGPAGQVRAA